MISTKMTRFKKFALYFILSAINIFIVTSCAKVVSPSGGPKDVTPPKMIKSNPENNAINFNKKKIEITFDEFIQLKDVNQKLTVSPPLKEKPTIYLNGKTVVVELNNELRTNSTYSLNFADAITDLNEGNVLSNFQFVFSTGTYVDSLMLSGNICNAFDLKQSDQVLVMLYETLADSAPLKVKPDYLSKTDASGKFSILNIKPGRYQLFALKDVNNNYIYDQANESIAFINTLVTPHIIAKPDSTHKTTIDTLALSLKLFDEDNKKQYISKTERPLRNKLTVCFNRPLFNNTLKISSLSFKSLENWGVLEQTLNKDSATIWLSQENAINLDSLKLTFEYEKKDSTGSYFTKKDTIIFKYKELQPSKKTDSTGTKLTHNIAATAFDLNKDIVIENPSPVLTFDANKIKLYQVVDTVETLVKINIVKDSILARKFHVKYNSLPEANYRLEVLPEAFIDIYKKTNDTLEVKYNTQRLEYYGNLFFVMQNISQPTIVQVLDSKNNIISEKHISTNCKITFDYLKPQKYVIKAIIDQNANGRWDTGNYLKKAQPESVLFYKDQINMRSNWDIEQTWILNN